MQERIGVHLTWKLPVLGTVHSDTIVTTWLVMVLALIFFAWIGASYRSARQSKRQTIFEGVINYIADLTHGVLGDQGEPFVPFFIALFIFIFLLNQFGMLPFKVLALPFGGSPTADLNTVVPYALMVWVMIQVVAFRRKGLGYLKHLIRPFPILLPLNIIDEILRPTTLAARLFFNIFVGELLFVIVASIIVAHVMLGPVNLSLAVTIVPFFIQFFNFFVGTVQAFVFTLLAIVYLSLAISPEH